VRYRPHVDSALVGLLGHFNRGEAAHKEERLL
jgi:hypothetical protein